MVKRNIYLYQVKMEGVSRLDPETVFNLFSERSNSNHFLTLEGQDYIFITHNKNGNLLGASFIKVKDVSQVILEKKSAVNIILSYFNFGKNQDPGEPSNLIWDMENGIILSEMNWSGARHISTKLGKYLSNILGRKIEITPLFNEEAYKQLFLTKRTIKKVSLTVPKPNVNIIQETIGADVKDIKKYIANDEDLNVEISLICKRNKKGLKLIPKSLIELYDKIKVSPQKDNLKLYVQDSNQITLSLLDGALLKEPIEFKLNIQTKSIDKNDFFKKVKNYLGSKKEEILDLLQNV